MYLIIRTLSKSIIYLFLLKVVLIYSNELILLQIYSSAKPGSYNNKLSFIEELYERNFYTTIEIGEPIYEIKTIFSMQNEYFALIPNKYNSNISYTNYNYTKSKTFKNISCLNEYLFESRNDSLVQEKFVLQKFDYKNNISNELIINDFNTIFGYNEKYKNNEYYLNIGLKIIMVYKNIEKRAFNFIYQLKEKRIIDNYYWSIFFEQGKNQNGKFIFNPEQLLNAKGKLIIGDLPNNYQPDKYHKSQLLTTYSYDKDQINAWGLEFNSIYHYNKKNIIVKDMYYSIYFDINNYLVLGPQTYYRQIKTEFFSEYFRKKICNIYTGNGFESIYCDKSENFTIKDLEEFPVLYFQNNELQYIFEFNYEDLFVEKDNKFWFLIAFPTYYDVEEWYFGIIFLRKYQLVFNPDAKTISFYNPKLPIEENDDNNSKPINNNNKNNNKSIFIVIIIVVLGIIFIGLGIYLGKIIYINKKNKKRFNELEDNFEYNGEEFDNEKNEDKNESNIIGV